MGKKIRTAKGDVVDFDLLKIKQQISTNPTPTDVKQRQQFVDKKLRRRYRKTQRKAENLTVDVNKNISDASYDEENVKREDSVNNTSTEVNETSTTTSNNTKSSPTKQTTKKKTTRQKARPPKSKSEENNEDQSNS